MKFFSKFVNQIAGANTESFGDSQQRVKTDPLLAAFNLANVNRVQIGFFGQLFLAQNSLLAVVANGITQYFELSRARHNATAKQRHAGWRTPNMGLFGACKFLGKA
jgi:hypothetical protein